MTIISDHGKISMTKPRIIPAGVFKARCLKLMDEVNEQGGELIITKHGKPVAKLVRAEGPKRSAESFGWMRGTAQIRGDIIGPFHEEWTLRDDDSV